MAENMRDRLTTALMDYAEIPSEVCVADLADYLIEVIDELHSHNCHSKGGIVIIRSDLAVGKNYGKTDVTEEMLNYCGKEAVIRNYNTDQEGGYLLDIDDEYWTWTDEMFK